MKNIIVLLAIAFISTSALFSQEKNESLDSVYVVSDTATLEVDYDFYYDGVKKYDGVVGYQFTVDNYIDTIQLIVLEGGYDGVNYTPIDSLTEPLDGNYSLFDTDPIYLKYRLGIYAAAEDTATLKNNIFFQKESK
ncbi:MAG: hypothetical protein GY870_11410 [archaeon]|nr:hypothetical protein [archaeon]